MINNLGPCCSHFRVLIRTQRGLPTINKWRSALQVESTFGACKILLSVPSRILPRACPEGPKLRDLVYERERGETCAKGSCEG